MTRDSAEIFGISSSGGGSSAPTDFLWLDNYDGVPGGATTTAHSFSFPNAGDISQQFGSAITIATNVGSTSTTAKQPKLTAGFYSIDFSCGASINTAGTFTVVFPALDPNGDDIDFSETFESSGSDKLHGSFYLNVASGTQFLDPRIRVNAGAGSSSRFTVQIVRISAALS